MSRNNENYHQNMKQERTERTDKIVADAKKTKTEEGLLHEKMLERAEKELKKD